MAEVGSPRGRGRIPDHRGSSLRALAHESVLNLTATVVSAALTFVLPVIVTRQLDADDAGVYFEAVAVFMLLLNLGMLGADTGTLRSLSRALAHGEHWAVPVYLSTAVRVPIVAALVTAVALVVSAPWLSELIIHGTDEHRRTMTHTLYVIAAFLPVAVGYGVGVSASRGLGSIRVLVFVDKIGKSAIQVVLVVAAALTVGSTVSVVIGWVTAYMLGAVVVSWWLRAYLRRRPVPAGEQVSAPARREAVREFWTFSGPRAVSRLCNVVMQRADVLLVGAILGPSDAAIYAAATRFLVLGTLLAQAIQQVMAPRISEAMAVDDIAEASMIYRITTTWLTLLSWPIYLLAGTFASLLLGIFGEGYDQGALALTILCLTMLVATSCGPVDSVLLMGGRSVLSLGNAVIALIVMVGLDVVLIPSLGVTGAAVGWAAAILVKNLLALIQVDIVLGLHPFVASLAVAMICSTLCFGALPLLMVAIWGMSASVLVVACVASVVTYGLSVRRFASSLELGVLYRVARGRARSND